MSEADGNHPLELSNYVEGLTLRLTSRTKLSALANERRNLAEPQLQEYLRYRKGIERLLHRVMKDGVDAGQFEVDDPQQTARAILGMIRSISTWYDAEGVAPQLALAKQYARIALRSVNWPDVDAICPVSTASATSRRPSRRGRAVLPL